MLDRIRSRKRRSRLGSPGLATRAKMETLRKFRRALRTEEQAATSTASMGHKPGNYFCRQFNSEGRSSAKADWFWILPGFLSRDPERPFAVPIYRRIGNVVEQPLCHLHSPEKVNSDAQQRAQTISQQPARASHLPAAIRSRSDFPFPIPIQGRPCPQCVPHLF